MKGCGPLAAAPTLTNMSIAGRPDLERSRASDAHRVVGNDISITPGQGILIDERRV
jgi:hypothetical protein